MRDARLETLTEWAELTEAEELAVDGGLMLTGSVVARGIIVVCRTGWLDFGSFVSIAPLPSP